MALPEAPRRVTEDAAQEWLRVRFGEAAFARLARFRELLCAVSEQHNLVSRSSMDMIWARHILDSAQLLAFAPTGVTPWIDVGTGAGFPGMIIALLDAREVILVEPRRLRADFLSDVVASMGIANVRIVQSKVEQLRSIEAAVISARAVSSLSSLLSQTRHMCTSHTVFLLPRGRNAMSEVEEVRQAWHGMFHVKHSLTDPASGIVVAHGLRAR